MNQIKYYNVISVLSLLCAIIFFAFYNHIITINLSFQKQDNVLKISHTHAKEIALYYFHHEKWNIDKQEALWSDSLSKNSYQLINALLTLLDEERITAKKIMLQTALCSSDHTLYLSFDHNPFSKQDTIFKKWMLIESILKTIKNNNIAIQSIQFLVQHQPLVDYHLDFSMPWPIEGFIQ